MLEAKWIIKNEKAYKASCAKRGVDSNFDLIKEKYEKVKSLTTEVNSFREEQNKISKEIPLFIKDKEKFTELKTQAKSLGEKIKSIQEELTVENLELTKILEIIPNVLDKHVPTGDSDKDNEVFFSSKVTEDLNSKNHFEITNDLNFVRSAKISGPRFNIMTGDIAKLYRALSQYMLDYHQEAGIEEYILPTLVKEEAMYGADKLPKFADDAFKDDSTNMWFIPTGEVPLVTQFMDEIIDLKSPLRMTALTSCYRKEAGSAGKDTRGLIRQHQFDKVEVVTICKPEDAKDEYIRMLNHIESLIKSLELDYRKVLLCSKDTGFGASKTIDFEVYFEGAKQFREISSCSTCGTFQTVRSNIRYKEEKTIHPHTMNGSALPVGRTLAAIMEKYQGEDNTLIVPKVLVPYMKKEIISLL